MHAMTKRSVEGKLVDLKRLVGEDEDYLRAMVQSLVEATLEAEMTAVLGAEKSVRTLERVGYRSGSWGRSLVTRVGTRELRVPQDRDGRFSTRLFERYQRSEKALVGGLGADVRARGFDAQGEGGHRRALRSQFLGLGDLCDQQEDGRGARAVCGASPGGGLPLPDPGRALAVETHENWLEATRYLNMGHLAEHKKEQMRRLDEAA